MAIFSKQRLVFLSRGSRVSVAMSHSVVEEEPKISRKHIGADVAARDAHAKNPQQRAGPYTPREENTEPIFLRTPMTREGLASEPLENQTGREPGKHKK